MALWAIPAGHLRAGRGLARVGGVACQRTSPVRVIRAALKPCITPRLGRNVLLAGKPRFVAKLHRPWPGGVVSPARANSSLVPRDAEDYGAAPHDASGDDVDASFGPGGVLWSVWTRHGQVLRTCPPLVHTRRPRAHILTASATTTHGKGDGSDRLPDCSVIPGNPSTEQTSQFPRGFHEKMRETTPITKATASAPSASRIASSSQAIRLRNKPANCRGDSTRHSEKQH